MKLSFHLLIVCFELFPRIELGTSSLPRKCSTTELKQHLLPKSGTKVQKRVESWWPVCEIFFVECGGRKLVEVGWVGCAWQLWSKAESVCGAKK